MKIQLSSRVSKEKSRTIKKGAFESSGLKGVLSIPGSVVHIEENAFRNKKLENIHKKSGLMDIWGYTAEVICENGLVWACGDLRMVRFATWKI